MMQAFMEEALVHGEKIQLIPIHRLQSIQHELESFTTNEDVNDFQKWIVNDLYTFDVPTVGFTIESIMLIAIPHPAYAEVEFEWQGKTYHSLSLAMSDFDTTERNLKSVLAQKNFHIISAPHLPLKRLSVKSGLACYGRNNICYIEGMGSMFSFVAYFSDIPCDHDCWMEIRKADMCAHCKICFNNCPTGAIRENRFLIDNERCLSFFNENAGEFPEWLPVSVHHCVYDCLKCQINCPMNKDYVNNVIGPIAFSEDETHMLLSGSPFETFSPAFQQKSQLLGLDQWPERLLSTQDKIHIRKLL
jgi:epoxyqueuosine reductase